MLLNLVVVSAHVLRMFPGKRVLLLLLLLGAGGPYQAQFRINPQQAIERRFIGA
jgi:hypothetical protein